jgi:hypothetical protein
MATTAEELLLKISGDTAGARQALESIGASLEKFKSQSEQVATSLDKLSTKFDQAAKAGKLIAVAFGGLAAIGGKLIKETAGIAMRNETLALSMYVVGKNAGYTRQELDALVDQLRDTGISAQKSADGPGPCRNC